MIITYSLHTLHTHLLYNTLENAFSEIKRIVSFKIALHFKAGFVV